MVKQPFDVNRDLGVPKVDWNKVNTGGEGPKRYPSELLETPTAEQLAMASSDGKPPGIPDEQEELPWDTERIEVIPEQQAVIQKLLDKHVIKDLTGQSIFGSKPLEEPIGETPKFNPVTQQFELPE